MTRRYNIMTCPVDTYSFNEAIEEISKRLEGDRTNPWLINFLNVGKIMMVRNNPELRDILWKADMVLPDGKPLLLFAKGLGIILPARVAGIDLMQSLLNIVSKKELSIYLLGAKKEVVEECVNVIKREYVGIKIGGYRNGYFRNGEIDGLIDAINQSNSDILFIGMPSPQKEVFAFKYRNKLDLKVIQGVGGSFDVIAGLAKRAPKWMQDAGMEWAFRVMQEPRRLFWRYFSTNILFLIFYLRDFVSYHLKKDE